MDGILIIDKPAGPSSHAVVARVRRAIGIRKIGHTGTLDPIATGVLPLVIGKATRLARFLSGREKTYEAEIRFGRSTDTYDRMGEFTPFGPARVALDRAGLESALDAFRGAFRQTPPAFSAKKVDGIRSYDLARKDAAVDLQPVSVTVQRLEILSFDPGDFTSPDPAAAPRLVIRMTVSAGFYVRALAHDLGRNLRCGGWLEALRRVKSGDFGVADAVPLERVEQEGPAARQRVIGLERLLPGIPGIVLTQDGLRRARHGNEIGPEDVASLAGPAPTRTRGTRVRLLDGAGSLVAIAEATGAGELLHPVIVLG